MLEFFTELTQRASDVSTWHTTLDALLCDEYGGSEYHTTQASLTEQLSDQAQQSLRQIATRAQRLAVQVQEDWDLSAVNPTGSNRAGVEFLCVNETSEW